MTLEFTILCLFSAAALGAVFGWLGGMGGARTLRSAVAAMNSEIDAVYEQLDGLSKRLSRREGQDGRARAQQQPSPADQALAEMIARRAGQQRPALVQPPEDFEGAARKAIERFDGRPQPKKQEG